MGPDDDLKDSRESLGEESEGRGAVRGPGDDLAFPNPMVLISSG